MISLLLLVACGPTYTLVDPGRGGLDDTPDDDDDVVEVGDDDDAPDRSTSTDPGDEPRPHGPVDSGGSDTGTVLDTGTPPAQPPEPGFDGRCWWEPIHPDVSLADLQPVSHGNRRDVAFEAFRRRWPAGHALLVDMAHDPYIDVFLDGSSWGAFSDSLLIVAHEETHGWDYEHALYPNHFGFFFLADYQPGGPWFDTLPRSVIRPLIDDQATGLYADLYLTGTQGTYGFTELLDETTCYVNDLGAAVAFADGLPWTLSARDGALSFLYYTAVYLDYAEHNAPALYASWQADPEIVATVRDLWLRTHFFVEVAGGDPRLGVYDQQIFPLMYAEQPALEAFLGLSLDDSSCLP
mgnify:CR=1 FL=1